VRWRRPKIEFSEAKLLQQPIKPKMATTHSRLARRPAPDEATPLLPTHNEPYVCDTSSWPLARWTAAELAHAIGTRKIRTTTNCELSFSEYVAPPPPPLLSDASTSAPTSGACGKDRGAAVGEEAATGGKAGVYANGANEKGYMRAVSVAGPVWEAAVPVQQLVMGAAQSDFKHFLFVGHPGHCSGLHHDVSDVFVTVVSGKKLELLVADEDIHTHPLRPCDASQLQLPYGRGDMVDISTSSWDFLVKPNVDSANGAPDGDSVVVPKGRADLTPSLPGADAEHCACCSARAAGVHALHLPRNAAEASLQQPSNMVYGGLKCHLCGKTRRTAAIALARNLVSLYVCT
jgi:hypothetical protein